ncbi:hypothetical protein [Streptomyces sp. NPDC059009]|uniref:hypothetical protein n=1 Tax=Streptomyces sp. NPDC059009 TaxID=3346694 RepID=UPI00367A517E
MPLQFMDSKQSAEYLNVSITWTYRDGPQLGLAAYKFGTDRNAKLQFMISTWTRGIDSNVSADTAARNRGLVLA